MQGCAERKEKAVRKLHIHIKEECSKEKLLGLDELLFAPPVLVSNTQNTFQVPYTVTQKVEDCNDIP